MTRRYKSVAVRQRKRVVKKDRPGRLCKDTAEVREDLEVRGKSNSVFGNDHSLKHTSSSPCSTFSLTIALINVQETQSNLKGLYLSEG